MKSRNKEYDYSGKALDTSIIDKKIREDFSKFCKEKKIVKSKLIEEFFRKILLRFREGNLNEANGYITIDVLSSAVRKG